MSQFLNYINKYTLLQDEEAEQILSYFETEEIKKNEFILEQGEICRYNYFVLKGCLRIYIFNDAGKEQILHFAIENWWISDLSSYFNQTKSRCYIQALENSQVIKISYQNYNQLVVENQNFSQFMRIIFQQSFTNLQEHFVDTLNRNGKARYLDFIQKHPNLVQRVSQYMIASYLGLTPEFISKVRKKIVQ
ncbi:Crp/Fnr family transcriptional regulator [Myroides odoratus]|uniref:Crp/Fnr family transcriptional regulator n=1 Tax=Myroides odoratus TaxID=256 RepID=UPI0033422808